MRLDKKNKLLIGIFLVVLYVCYQLAISKTVTYYKTYKAQQQSIADNHYNPKLAGELKLREKLLDTLLTQYKISTSASFQNDLLKAVNTYCSRYALKITDFKEPHQVTENGIRTTSYIFTVEGSFNGCLLLLNQLENSPKFGSIQHASFKKQTDYKSNTDKLYFEIILQKNESN